MIKTDFETADKCKKKLKVIMLFLVFLFATGNTLFAEEEKKKTGSNLKIGRFEVHPSISAKELFDSNIFSESKAETPDNDWISIVTPALNIKYPGKRLILDLDYSAVIERYSRFKNEDTEKHTASVKAEYITASNKMEYKFSNIYLDTKDPASSDTESNQDTNRADRIQNTLTGSAKIKFGKNIQITIDGSNDYGKYDLVELDAENTTTSRIGLSAYYKFKPKTSATVNYHYGIIDYRDATTAKNSDSKSHVIRAGISIDATAKLSGEATFGYEKRDYKQTAFADDDTQSVEMKVMWRPQKRTSVNLLATRSLEESSYGTNSASYIRTSMTIDASHKFTEKVSGKVTGKLANSDYPGRSDNSMGLEADLKYEIRDWFFINANYSYKNNNSDVNDKDYRINKAFLMIGATF